MKLQNPLYMTTWLALSADSVAAVISGIYIIASSVFFIVTRSIHDAECFVFDNPSDVSADGAVIIEQQRNQNTTNNNNNNNATTIIMSHYHYHYESVYKLSLPHFL